MGDMADMLIEQGIQNMLDGLDDFPATRACRYCDERDLHWEFINGGWRLHDYAGVIHNCPEYRK